MMSACAEPGSKANQATGNKRREWGYRGWPKELCAVQHAPARGRSVVSRFHAAMQEGVPRCPGPQGAVSEQTGATSWEVVLSAPRSRRRTQDRFSRGYLTQTALPTRWSGSEVASILEGASPFTRWLGQQYTGDIKGEGALRCLCYPEAGRLGSTVLDGGGIKHTEWNQEMSLRQKCWHLIVFENVLSASGSSKAAKLSATWNNFHECDFGRETGRFLRTLKITVCMLLLTLTCKLFCWSSRYFGH